LKGSFNLKKGEAIFEYKAECMGKVLEMKRNFIFGQRGLKE